MYNNINSHNGLTQNILAFSVPRDAAVYRIAIRRQPDFSRIFLQWTNTTLELVHFPSFFHVLLALYRSPSNPPRYAPEHRGLERDRFDCLSIKKNKFFFLQILSFPFFFFQVPKNIIEYGRSFPKLLLLFFFFFFLISNSSF